jgi:hypothetical protein
MEKITIKDKHFTFTYNWLKLLREVSFHYVIAAVLYTKPAIIGNIVFFSCHSAYTHFTEKSQGADI